MEKKLIVTVAVESLDGSVATKVEKQCVVSRCSPEELKDKIYRLNVHVTHMITKINHFPSDKEGEDHGA